MISYGRNAVKSLALANQQASILNIMFHAKSLSQTFGTSDVPFGEQVCSYGVQIDKNSITVNGTTYSGQVFAFRDLVPTLSDCDTVANNQYAPSDNAGERLPGATNNFYLDNAFNFTAATDFKYVAFIPPDPKTIINNSPTDPLDPSAGTKIASIVVQSTIDSNIKFTIQINNYGEISVK